MNKPSLLLDVDIVSLVNLEIDSYLVFDDAVISRDHSGYLIRLNNEHTDDCVFRRPDAQSVVSSVKEFSAGVSLKYYCDSHMIYVGTTGIPVSRLPEEPLKDAIKRSAEERGLSFKELGEESVNLFDTYYPVLVSKASFDQVSLEVLQEEGKTILKDFFKQAVSKTGELEKPWSVFPEGTLRSEIHQWLLERYHLNDEDDQTSQPMYQCQ